MKLYFTHSLFKVLNNGADIPQIKGGSCLINEEFNFQVIIESEGPVSGRLEVISDFDKIEIYEELYLPGGSLDPITDGYKLNAGDNMYPDPLLPTKELTFAGRKAFWVHVFANKPHAAGTHKIKVSFKEAGAVFELEVYEGTLPETDLKITAWLHCDCICEKHGTEPFTPDFYKVLGRYLEWYTRSGNNMLLIPLFTPPLDTEPGLYRKTVQLVGVSVKDGVYSFDFGELFRFIDFVSQYGIKYYELSHLFSQWGGEFSPQIVGTENGERRRLFGWDIKADSGEYLDFLSRFLPALDACLEERGLKERCFLHITDEPNGSHIAQYKKLSAFVKSKIKGVKTFDAMSNYEFFEEGCVDIPVVTIKSADYDKFKGTDRFIYYCCCEHENFLTNRWLAMPLQRARILGFLSYCEDVRGFLHWGFNFYHSRHSLSEINPYETADGSGAYPGGDPFIVYPGEMSAYPSVRLFTMQEVWQDYRALMALSAVRGREYVLQLLKDEGVTDLHTYPRSADWHLAFRDRLNRELSLPD